MPENVRVLFHEALPRAEVLRSTDPSSDLPTHHPPHVPALPAPTGSRIPEPEVWAGRRLDTSPGMNEATLLLILLTAGVLVCQIILVVHTVVGLHHG